MNDKNNIVAGQRWLSTAEPELGLGIVSKVHQGKINLQFSLSNLTRQYTIIRAPIKRIRFKPGDLLTTQKGESFVVEELKEVNGLFYYKYNNNQLCETELADTIPVNNPIERLETLDFDPEWTFELRYQTLLMREHMHKSGVRGFCGGRIDLIPHQLYIADTVAARYVPRVMLSDQVGLGKTIEALLIIKKLIVTSRAKRILIIVPEYLVLQWFGELYHRFNLTFSVIDEHYCREEERKDPDFDPFDERQLCICSYSVFTTFSRLRALSLEKAWDMVVIDEVHNLHQASEEYDFFKTLTGLTPGLMLLTAIPEFPNLEDFFARLHLIDPVFYDKYERFFWEVDRYKWVAGLAETLRKNKPLQSDHIDFLREKLSANFPEKNIAAGDDSKPDKGTRKKILDYLIDQHGMGRLLFRNNRKTISGFPKRIVHLETLDQGADNTLAERLVTEFEFDVKERETQPDYIFVKDPRISWLLSLLKKEKKILLICASKEKVLALADALKINGFKDFLCFHEDIEFLKRDQQVTLFYQPEGPQLLLSSEIGSEGRNFQFCSNLVLFDVPFDPSLIEQRIGRLDRIGQQNPVNIFIPFIKESPQAVMIQWFYRGLNIFKEFYDGHNQSFSMYSSFVKNMALKGNYNQEELDNIINETKKEYTKIKKKNEKARDILVELNSFDEIKAKEIIDDIHREDNNNDFENNIIDLLEYYGFYLESIDNKT
ncbi:MAG: RNA polymerase-associated protein RapA, partial [Spirochaetales bacterium]|nr:RNA polymerase-associated protein RapA [Spirochaetales bacterium]